MSQINVTNLTFAYDGSCDNIFENVSFQIDTDWRLGFIGRNGRGKTTFLNLLLGKYDYSGVISSSVNFEYFPFDISDDSQYAIDAAMSICPNREQWEIMRELSLLDVPQEALYMPFNTLSAGQQAKIKLAAMFLKDNCFMLIDEPTNHLDARARLSVGQYLRRKHGFILVSHDRQLLDCCVDHVLSINRTGIDIQKGNFSSWQENKQREDCRELSENDKIKKDIGRLNQAARRTNDWSDKVESAKIGSRNSGLRPDRGYIGHKAAKMMKRSKSIESRMDKAIEQKSSLLKNIEADEDLKLSPLTFHTGRLLELSGVSITYGEHMVCDNVSFTVEQGDRIALTGKNGCGKSSILKLICGLDVPYAGSIYKNGQLKISYVPQDYSELSGSLYDYADSYDIDQSRFFTVLRKLDFSRAQFEKPMDDYSAGQRKKVLLARSLCESAHLYVWDEPLNYIDVISRMQIERLLTKFKPTILFVEHDQAFCDNIMTKSISL